MSDSPNWISRLRSIVGLRQKHSEARTIATLMQQGREISTPANYESYAKQGYMKSVVVYACISKIAQACAGIKWELYSKSKNGEREEIIESPLLTLMKRPNPMQAQAQFIESVISFLQIAGNSYIEANLVGKVPLELWPARPDHMTIRGGKQGYPEAYVYKSGGATKVFPVDFVKMTSQILHLKKFNPIDNWYGMSPMQAALLSLDQNNMASRWNLSLLQNSATPSGVLQMKVSDMNPGGTMTDKQFNDLRQDLDASFSGARNAGRPMLLEGGLEWKQISLSPKDMEFLKSKEVTALDICLAFGVPPEVLGMGQKTFQNYKEARLSFYEETILPQMDFLRDELNRWLTPSFGEGLELDYDRDDVEALAYKREVKHGMVKDANYLTQNEKRSAVGYEEVEGLDVFVIGSQLLTAEQMALGTEPMTEEDPIDPAVEDEKPDDEKPKNPKKPAADEDDNALNSEDDMEEDGKSWKSINVLNQNERRKSWKRQNARRARLESAFRRDIAEDLREMNEDIVKAVTVAGETQVREYALALAIDKNTPALTKTISRHLKYTLDDFGSQVFEEAKGLEFVPEHKASVRYETWIQSYIKRRTAKAVTEIDGSTKKKARQVIKRLVEANILEGNTNTDLSNELQKEFDSLTPGRSRVIARTEVAMASNNASREAVKTLQIPGMEKEWVSANDGRVRDGGDDGNHADHEAVNGTSVPIDQKFSVPPDADMDGPGDESAGAEQVCNCRCVLVFNSRGK